MTYGQGSIFYNSKRKLYYLAIVDNSGKRRCLGGYKDKQPVIDLQTEMNYKKLHGQFNYCTDTIGDFVYTWLNIYAKAKVSVTTFRTYRGSAAHLSPIANILVKDLKPERIQQLYNDLNAKFSDSTVSKVHKILFAAFKQAHRNKQIGENLMLLVDAPRIRKKQIETFTDAELSAVSDCFITHPEIQQYKLLFLVAIMTGVRQGELLALRWKDLDTNNNLIHICQTKLQLTGDHFKPPKTAAGLRSIPIPEQLTKLLDKKRQDSSFKEPDNLIFCTNTGHSYTSSNIIRTWHKIRTLIGVNKKFHVFRHTYATKMLAAGIPVLEVARCLGHASPSVTLNIYGHAIPGFNDIIGSKTLTVFHSANKLLTP